MKLTTNRRNFVRTLSLGGMYVMAGKFPAYAAVDDVDFVKIVILHTNDVHSRVEPFPMDGSRNQGKAGVAKRAVLIDKVRAMRRQTNTINYGEELPLAQGIKFDL